MGVGPPATIVDALAAIMRGDEIAADRWRAINLDVEAFCQAAGHHGVLSLVAERLPTMRSGPSAPLATQVGALARRHAAADLATEVELRAALAALDAAGVQPIVFKGAHLAYSDYARPDLRPRLDTDVLIPADPAARHAAHAMLLQLGYETAPHVGGDFVMTQRAYALRRGGGLRHAIDVHWRIANPQLFSRVLLHDEVARDAVSLPRLSRVARGPSGAHALLIACVHRVAHHADSDCLIWLYDIDQIARRLVDEEWSGFQAIVTKRQVVAVCCASLDRAVARFATPVPGRVSAAMQAAASVAREASAGYLSPPQGAVQAALSDLRALPSLADRARLVREHLMPPADYMRGVYAPGSRAPLAWLYGKRVIVGARRWFRRRKTASESMS